MLKKNLKVLTAIFLIALIAFSSITLLAKLGRALKLDLTEDRIYSLSDETGKIIGGLTHPVRLKLFFSRTEALKGFDSLRAYNNYFFYIRDLVREYAARSHGKITVEIIDPRRDSREEREALQYGLRPIPTAGDDRFFFGLVLTTEFGQEKAITLLAPERQQLAEYDITEMIYSATSRAKKKIGILASVDLAASKYPAEMARSMGIATEPGRKGQSVLEQIKSHYDVTMLAADGSAFQKLDAVVVIHPRNLSEQTLAALDRYVTGGGKLVVFQDPAFMADPLAGAAGSTYAPGQNASNLNRLLSAWGCEMPADRIAADPGMAALGSPGPDPASARPATLLTLKGNAIQHADGLQRRGYAGPGAQRGNAADQGGPRESRPHPFCRHPTRATPSERTARSKGQPPERKTSAWACVSREPSPSALEGYPATDAPKVARTGRDKAPGRKSRRDCRVSSPTWTC